LTAGVISIRLSFEVSDGASMLFEVTTRDRARDNAFPDVCS
jgi:hypothetical protein